MTGGSDDHGLYQPGGQAQGAGGLGAETTPPAEYARLLAKAARAGGYG
jgi:hypothetical protein